jgi:formylglycine-generating enzyme
MKTFMKTMILLTFLVVLFAAMPVAAQTTAPEDTALIPAGTFWMGRHIAIFLDAKDLVPRDKKNVYLDAFYIDRYEVTNAAYAGFIEASGRRPPWHWPQGEIPEGQENFPVYNVDWFDADAFCRAAGKRLPTEAEWEKAARGGLDRNRYSWGDEDVDFSQEYLFAPQSSGRASDEPVPAALGLPRPAPVGTYAPNGYGLYDMGGNVSEWTSDWYDGNYYPFMPKENPKGPETGRYRSVRGTNWMDDDGHGESQSVYYRNFSDPDTVTLVIGFRCAQTP